MLSTVLTVHEGLGAARRFPALARIGPRVSAWEFAVLVLLGAAAAVVSVFVKDKLGVPGHNIVRVVFPLALGLALVPRRGAASVMGLSGMGAAMIFLLGGERGLGAGAATSLVLTGLLLDLALLGARSGPSVYLRLTLAGLAANAAAFLVRGGVKLLSGGLVDGHPLELWWPKAAVTYPLCGLLAGLISAAVWFRITARTSPKGDSPIFAARKSGQSPRENRDSPRAKIAQNDEAAR